MTNYGLASDQLFILQQNDDDEKVDNPRCYLTTLANSTESEVREAMRLATNP